MTNPNTVFIDTNILVYANLSLSPFHQQAVEKLQALDALKVSLWVNRQVFREYLAVMSRPSTLTSAIPKESLVSDIRYFAERFQVAEENSSVTERLLLLIQETAIGGKQIHDANIVATMQVYKIDCILTHNVQDFNRFSRWLTVSPLQG